MMLGKIEGRRRRDDRGKMAGWHHQLSGHEVVYSPELVVDRESWHAAIHVVAKS